jgi:hypothetical protein
MWVKGMQDRGVRSVPSVSIEPPEHQSEAPTNGLVCPQSGVTQEGAQYCRLEKDACRSIKGRKYEKRREKKKL